MLDRKLPGAFSCAHLPRGVLGLQVLHLQHLALLFLKFRFRGSNSGCFAASKHFYPLSHLTWLYNMIALVCFLLLQYNWPEPTCGGKDWFSFHVLSHRPSLRNVGTAEILEEHCLLACSPWLSFVYYPGPPAQGLTLPSMFRSLLCQSLVKKKKIPQEFPYRSIWWRHFLNWHSLFLNDPSLCRADK